MDSQRNQQTTSKNRKRNFFALVIVTALVFTAGLSAGVMIYINNRSDKVLADALSNSAADLLGGKPSSAIGSLVFESNTDPGMKVTIKFDSKASAENSAGSASVQIGYSGKTFNLKASTVIFGDNEFYFKIENLKQTISDVVNTQPVFGTYAAYFDPIVAKLDNKWVRVTKDDLKQFGEVDEQTVDKCTTALKELKLSKADQKQLKKLFKENQFIVASENLKPERVGDERSYHYKLNLNNAAAESFSKQVISMDSFKTLKTDCELTEEKLAQEFRQNDKDQKTSTPKPVIELWVGKNSRRPTKIRISVNNKDVAVNFSAQVKSNAKNIIIEKPTDVMLITDIKTELERINSNISNL